MTDKSATSPQVDFLASHIPPLGSDEARMMTVRSGRNIVESYLGENLDGSLVKMLLESSIWNSTECYLTWKTLVTPSMCLLFQLVPSEPDTDDPESGLLPTPIARDYKDSAAPVFRNGVQQKDTLGRAIGGTPHPEFVEAMMGYPIGWTALED